jgi:HAD superfamily hydrolase (TIGR01459 family)
VRRITKIGVPLGLYHAVMSSGEEAWQYLHDRTDPFYAALGRRCLHICSERDLEIREGLDLDFVETPAEADFILNTGPAEWEDTYEDYAPLLQGARARDLPMVCANPDLVVIHAGRAALCAGAIAEQYEMLGGRVRWHGKPYPSVYDSCLALLGIAERSRIMAIGDSLRTDIAGAARAGIDSLFITGGIHAAELSTKGVVDRDRVAAMLLDDRSSPIAVAAGFVW